MKTPRLVASILLAGLPCLAADEVSPDVGQRLKQLIEADSVRMGGWLGMHVVQLSSGQVLFELNGNRLFHPASNLKLLTSSLALERLKLDYRYTTQVLREASGDVVLVGSGDPSLSSRVFPYDKTSRGGPPLQAIDDLADQIVARGVEQIHGDIVGDDRLYPRDPYPPSWTIDDSWNDYGAPVSALSLNENVIALKLTPGARAGDLAALAFSPALEYLTVDNRVVTAARGRAADVHFQRVSQSNQWRVTGTIPLGGAGHTEWLPVDDPALFAVTALYDALIRRGVGIRGRPVARHREPGDPYLPPAGEELAVRVSPPLGQLLQMMNKVSDNLYAELFLREVARVAGREATSSTAIRELGAHLTQLGAPASDWHLDDGSGLSRNALVTPRLFTQVLTRWASSENRDAWISFLPIGGEDGTLDKRLCCVSQGKGIRAKTGTLDRVVALSGYADSKSSGLLAFSILLNDYSARAPDARAWIDKIAAALLE